MNTVITTKFDSHNLKLLILLFIVSLEGCLTAGTHGSIKFYSFNTNKKNLQEAVEKVIAKNKLIQLDTLRNYMIDVKDGRNDTIFNNRYNDRENYLTIYIRTDDINNQYTIQYSGDKEQWDTAKNSELSIAYAFDKNGNGGSEGDGGIKWYNWSLRKRLLQPFEKELISNVEKELEFKHVD